MLDMSKAFGTVNRSKLMNILKEILTASELFMMHVLINDVIHMNSRIQNADLPFCTKYPILLPNDHRYVRCLVQHTHDDMYHCGVHPKRSNTPNVLWQLNYV